MNKTKIFIAEDEAALRNCFEIYLRRNYPNCEIECFSNGDDLNSALTELNGKLNGKLVVITDYHMPGKSIENIISEYHSLYFFILCTSDYHQGEKIRDKYLIPFIKKPFFLDEIKTTLDNILNT